MECCENRGQSEGRGIVREANSQPPRAAVRHELYAADGVLDLVEDVARLDKEVCARRCEPGKTMPRPREQTDAHLLFQPGYLFGDRRLRDLKSVGRATEIQLLGHDHEISEVPKLNISMTNIIRQAGAARRTWFSRNSHLCHCQLNRCAPEGRSSMRVRQFATQHPLSARFPLRRYFVRKFKFSAELMVSYFHLMIASNLPFDPQASVAGRIRRIGALGDDPLKRHGAGVLVKHLAMPGLVIGVVQRWADI